MDRGGLGVVLAVVPLGGPRPFSGAAMEPTYDQINEVLQVVSSTYEAVRAIADLLGVLCQLSIKLGGLAIGSVIWRNFILAKNQRAFL